MTSDSNQTKISTSREFESRIRHESHCLYMRVMPVSGLKSCKVQINVCPVRKKYMTISLLQSRDEEMHFLMQRRICAHRYSELPLRKADLTSTMVLHSRRLDILVKSLRDRV